MTVGALDARRHFLEAAAQLCCEEGMLAGKTRNAA